MTLDFTDYRVPVHTQSALTRYVDQGLYPGSFLESVLCNDLIGAVIKADGYNRDALVEIVRFVINELPETAWGSAEDMAAWIETHYELEH